MCIKTVEFLRGGVCVWVCVWWGGGVCIFVVFGPTDIHIWLFFSSDVAPPGNSASFHAVSPAAFSSSHLNSDKVFQFLSFYHRAPRRGVLLLHFLFMSDRVVFASCTKNVSFFAFHDIRIHFLRGKKPIAVASKFFCFKVDQASHLHFQNGLNIVPQDSSP